MEVERKRSRYIPLISLDGSLKSAVSLRSLGFEILLEVVEAFSCKMVYCVWGIHACLCCE